MRAYLRSSLVVVLLAAAGCGDGKPSTDARDGASDGKTDGSSNDRADVGTDKPATGGNGGATTGTGGNAGEGGAAGTTGSAGTGTGGTAGTAAGGASGDDGGVAGNDGGGNDGAAPTCTDGIKNSDETGIDCGGHCGKCAPGNPCLVNGDCQYACRADKTCAACTVAADCPGAETECEHRTCTAGVCGSMRDAPGTVLTVQSTGDCKRRQCGTDGQVAVVNDDSDVPDDRNPCTNDICTTGTASHTMMPANSNCGGANHCNATGQCVGCAVAADCPGTDTACRTRTCTAGGVCGFSFAASGTKLVDPTAGDCKGLQCDGNGNEQVYNNNADLPVDNNVCTTDECSSGTPSHRPVASGTACGGSLVCDGASKCVECLSASTCPGTDAECHTRSCVSGECGVANMAMGTLVAAQTARDCKKNVCNGQGGVTTVNDDLDLPVDSNACTFDVCTAGTPSNPNVPSGNSCGTNTICDGQGACVTCLTASSCPGTDTECHHRTCTSGVCGIANTAAGTALATQTAGDCKRNQCDGNGGSMIVNDDTDKPVDGNACTSDVCTAGVPSNPRLATGTTCGTNLMCNDQGACVGCITAANCGTDTTCQTHTCTNGQCGVNNTAAGTPLPSANQTAGDCKRVQCDGQGQSTTVNDDTDKPVDGNACTKDLCTAGIASNPPEDSGTTCSQSNGSRCNGSGTAPACVQCLQPSDCPGTDTECHHRTCSAAGVCGISNDPDGKLVQAQTGRDCKKNICMGGEQVTVNDDLDLPEDNNGCTNDLCNAGVASHTPLAQDAACNENGGTRCDGAGACVQCNAKSQCGTDSVCQTFTCASGQCTTNNVANGMALPPGSQIARDCKTKVCNGNGGIVDAADDLDLPVDGNACTADNCNNGVASNPSLIAGAACSQGGGTMCNGSATAPACVECLQNSDCGTNTDCQSFTCNGSNQCVTNNVAQGTPLPASGQAAGDCKRNVCNGLGAVVINTDTSDVPVDGNPCTDDVCTGSVASNPFVNAGTACGTPGGSTQMCDGQGSCVGCLSAADCPTGNACQTPVCMTGGVCGFTPVAEFTVVTSTPGDCHHNECDGAGAIRSVVDNNDTPAATSNECLQPACNAGVPSQAPLAAGATCAQNGGTKCDGAGACVECILPSECGTDGACFSRTCDMGMCGVAFKQAGEATTSQTSGDCKLSICNGAGMVDTINDDSDPPAPTNDCMTPACSMGSVTVTPKAHGTSCTQNNGRTCDGSGTCRLTFNVVRIGDGVTPLVSGTSAAVFIEERTMNGTIIGTPVALPTTASGGNLAYTNSGSAASEGGLSLSGDGKYVTLVGYNTGTGTGSVSTTAGINRLVARVDAAGNYNTTTLLTAFLGDNVRGATTQDGSAFWVGGSSGGTTGGVWYVPLGSTGAGTQIVTTPNNATQPHIFDGQLYISASNSTFRSPMTVGTGLPTTGPIMPATMPNLPTATASPNSYVFLDMDSTVAGVDRLYIADNGGASVQGIQKWTKAANGIWTRSLTTFNLSPAVGFRGLAGVVTGSSATLVATTAESTTRLVVLVDDGTAGATPSAIMTSPANEMFRGVAFAPHL